MRNNNLKKLLTTASALSMIAFGAQEAAAAAKVNSVGDFNASAVVGGVTLNANAGNWVSFTGAHALTYDVLGGAGGVMAGAYSAAAGASINIAAAVPISVGSIVADAVNSVTIVSGNNGVVTTLTGAAYGTGTGASALGSAANNYSGLGTVALSNAGAGLTIAGTVGNVIFTNDIVASADGKGLLVVAAGATGNSFTGDIGVANANGNGLVSAILNESVTFKPAAGKKFVNLGETTVARGKTLTFDSADMTAGDLMTVGGKVNGITAAGDSNVAIQGTKNIKFLGKFGDARTQAISVSSTGVTEFNAAVTVDALGDALNISSTAGTVSFAVLAKATTGNVVTGGAAVNFNAGLEITAGNLTTGTGLVTVGAAATTIARPQSLVTVGTGGFTTGQNITFANGGRMVLNGKLKVIDAKTVSKADITGTGDIEINGGNVTFSKTNIGYATLARGAGANAKSDDVPTIKVASANSVIIDADIIANGPSNIYSAITNTSNLDVVAGHVADFMASGGAGAINLYADIGEDAAKRQFARVTIADNSTVNLKDGASIYTTTIAGGTLGTVEITGAAAHLGLSDDSLVNGVFKPMVGNNGTIDVNTISGVAEIQYADTANSLLSISFNQDRNGAASKENGLVINTGTRTNPTTGTTFATRGISFGNNVIAGDTNTGLSIDMTVLLETDVATNLAVGADNVAVNKAGAGAIGFVRTDDKQVKKATFDVGGNIVGTAAIPLGLINASGAKELVITNTGAGVYVKDIQADMLTLTGAGTYGFNISGADSVVNVSGANVALEGITDSGTAVSNIGTSTTAIKEFHFATDHSAKAATGVNVYATNITVATTNNGVLEVRGNNVISGTIGASGKVLKQITVNNDALADSVATFRNGDIWVGATGVTFGAGNDRAVFEGNVHGAIRGTAAANGIATFGKDASSAVTVDGQGNNGIAINVAKINGTLNLTAGAYDAGNTTFLGDGTLNLTKDVTVTSLGVVTTSADGNNGTIAINKATITTGHVGTSTRGLKAFTIGEKATLTVADANNLYAKDVTGAGATVVFNSAAGNTSNTGNLGASGANLAAVTHGGTGAVVANDIFADAISINGVGGDATLTAKNFTTSAAAGTKITDVDATAIITDGGSIVKATGAGNVKTLGDATVTGLANTGTFTIDGPAGKVVKVTDAAIAGAVAHNTGTLTLTKDTTVAGTYTAGTAVLNLGSNSLTTGAATVTTSLTLNVSPSNGKAIIIAPSLVNDGTISIAPVEAAFATGSSSLVAATAAGAAIVPTGTGKVVVGKTDFTTGEYVPTTGVIKWTTKADRKAVLGNLATTTDENIGVFADAVAKAINAGDIKGDFATMLQNRAVMTSEEKVELATRTSNKTADAVTSQTIAPAVLQAAAGAAIGAATSTADTRIASTNAGVAAGDAGEKFGVWAQVIGGTATQKQRKNLSGFKSNMMGGMLGADTMLSDNATFGVLVGNVNNNMKFKDSAAGDKSKANSWIFGLYGNYDIAATDFFVQGSLTVAQTSVNAKSKQLAKTGGVYETAKGKYDVLGVGAQLVGGYKFKFDNSYVAPTAGLRYSYFGDTSYTQTGMTVGNQAVKTGTTSILSGLAGVKIGTSVDMDGTMINPEVHTNVSYAFNSPASKTSYDIKGLGAVNYKGPKASRFGANFGAGVMAEADGFEYGVGYDANISDKYLAHQGSLKVKVKF